MYSLQQNWRTRGQNRSAQKEGWEGGRKVAHTMYTHVSKCKNDKIEERLKK
jgi:hypothetical protein